MADIIEVAKSGRASCRTCRQPIPKGDLRFGEEQVNQFSGDGDMTHRWHHMACAAQKLPNKLKDAMEVFADEIPGKEELEKAIAEAVVKLKGKSDAFPYADVAPTGRAKCIQCRAAIEKGALRVAVEREIAMGMSTTVGAGYLHPGCVSQYLEANEKGPLEDLIVALRKHTTGLSPEELDGVIGAM